MLGYMPVPENFKYADVLRQGRPMHERRDIFAVKHPAMPLGKRAKIFSPFDALKGYDEAIAAKLAEHNAMYEGRSSDDTDDEYIGYGDRHG